MGGAERQRRPTLRVACSAKRTQHIIANLIPSVAANHPVGGKHRSDVFEQPSEVAQPRNAIVNTNEKLLLFESNGGAICDYEKHRTTSTAKFRVIQVNTYHGIGSDFWGFLAKFL